MREKAFTLVEMIIVLAILSVLSVIFVEIFFRTLRSGNKVQILGVVKHNGQVALETMDKIIRGADRVVCPSANSQGDTLVVEENNENNQFIRFKFNPPTPTLNGFISQDSVGDCTTALGTYSSLTNKDPVNGASVLTGEFIINSRNGSSDLVTIDFDIGPAVRIPRTLTDTADPIPFTTTVELR